MLKCLVIVAVLLPGLSGALGVRAKTSLDADELQLIPEKDDAGPDADAAAPPRWPPIDPERDGGR